MKRNLLCLTFTEDSLTIFNMDINSQPHIPAQNRSHPKPQEIDLKMKIEIFLKSGKLQENWFVLKRNLESNQFAEFRLFKADILQENWITLNANLEFGQFGRFRQQASELREFSLELYGSYRSVHHQGDRYIITFDRGEVALEFTVDLQGRIILPQFIC
jgi:hypothetical protein